MWHLFAGIVAVSKNLVNNFGFDHFNFESSEKLVRMTITFGTLLSGCETASSYKDSPLVLR